MLAFKFFPYKYEITGTIYLVVFVFLMLEDVLSSNLPFPVDEKIKYQLIQETINTNGPGDFFTRISSCNQNMFHIYSSLTY